MIRINKLATEIIKKYEGLRLEAYICPAGVATIGYGTTRYETGRKVKLGEVITEQRAEELLNHEIEKIIPILYKYVSHPITAKQEAALISFVYNLGEGNFRSSTLLKKLNSGLTLETANEFERWVHAGGKVLAGLVKRRKEEKELFLMA